MREMVEYILKQIVDNPEEVKVEEIKGEKDIQAGAVTLGG